MKRTVIGLVIVGLSVALLSMFSASAHAGRRHRPYCEQIGGYCYEIQFGDIDDDVHLFVNGQEVFSQYLTQGKDTGRIAIDHWLQPGPNVVDIRLGNGGCWRSSLNVTIFANGQIAFPTRGYWQEISHCGWQLQWQYSFDREAGIEQLQ